MGAILRNGFESGSAAGSCLLPVGLAALSTVTSSTVSSITPRKDVNGNGGIYMLNKQSNQGCRINIGRNVREGFCKLPCFVYADSGAAENVIFSFETPTNKQFGINYIQGTGSIRITSPADTLQGTQTFGFGGAFKVFYIRFYVNNTNGYINVFIDGNFSSPVLSFSGNTTAGAPTPTSLSALVLPPLVNKAVLYDDLAINDITMSYTSGSGTLPSVNDTILGLTSGARAVITAILPGSTSSSGTFQLALVRDSSLVNWNGMMANSPFLTETIDDSLSSNLWSADITGLDKNSGYPENGFSIALTPNADVAGKIELDRSSGSTNFSNINAIPANLTNYVSTAVTGERDVYELANFPFSSSLVSRISTVTPFVQWQRTDTVINNGKLILEHSSTEYDSASIPLQTSISANNLIYDKIPDGTDFSVSNVDTLRIGIKLES